MRRLLIFAIMLLPQLLLAQSYSTNRSRGRIEIKGDVAVSQLVQKHIELNERVRTIPGYRIQVASLSGTSSKNRAFEMKDRIREAYPGVEAYVVLKDVLESILVECLFFLMDIMQISYFQLK